MTKPVPITCPACGNVFRRPVSKARVRANQTNGVEGGRPKGAKDKQPRKRKPQTEKPNG